MTPTKYLHKTGEFSTHLALTCFAVGTILLVLHLNFPDNLNLFLIGLCFVVVAFICNLIVLVHLISLFIKHPFQREYFAIKIMILLANLPVTYCYLLLVFNK